MLVTFPLIFVVDTKIIFGYNFVVIEYIYFSCIQLRSVLEKILRLA